MDMYCAIRDYGSIVLAKDLCWVECEKSRFVYGVCLWQVDRLWSVYRVASVSCGRSHALVLSVIGVVFSCGLGSQGQLGHGTLEFQSGLRVVEALEGLRMGEVCAGGWHSMALSDTRDVYVWGWNNDGQLGLRQTQVRVCVCVCEEYHWTWVETGVWYLSLPWFSDVILCFSCDCFIASDQLPLD